MEIPMRRTSTLAVAVLAGALPALADTTVIPLGYDATPGGSTFLGPLTTGARTYLMLIHADQLTSLVATELTAIAFRNPTAASANWPANDVTIADYDIYLSPSVPPADRSLTFSENIAGTQTQVRSGSLFIPAGSYTWGGTPNAFGPEIEFTQGWTYTGGHLLIEIRHSGTGTSRSSDAIGTSVTGYGTQFSAAWASGSTATAGSGGNFTVVRITAEGSACYANCDGSTTEPVLNVEDFICFINAFAAGCP
jgi:hypothetical protein